MSKYSSIENSYGSVDAFRSKAKRWIRKVLNEHFEHNSALSVIRRKNVDWNDPIVLGIVEYNYTSIEHIEWIQNVLNRIEKMRSDLNKIPESISDDRHPKIHENVEREISSAVNFIDSVESYVHKNLHITEKQLEALNNVYTKYTK